MLRLRLRHYLWLAILLGPLALAGGSVVWFAQADWLSRARFQRIDVGMTPAEVEAILGRAPDSILLADCYLTPPNRMREYRLSQEGLQVFVDFDQGDQVKMVLCRRLTDQDRRRLHLPPETVLQRAEGWLRAHFASKKARRASKPHIIIDFD